EMLVGLLKDAQVVVQLAHKPGQRAPLELLAFGSKTQRHAIRGPLDHYLDEFTVVFDVLLEFALLDAIERRLGNVYMPPANQIDHVAEEEGQEQSADVGTVHIGVGHEDDLAVAQLG